MIALGRIFNDGNATSVGCSEHVGHVGHARDAGAAGDAGDAGHDRHDRRAARFDDLGQRLARRQRELRRARRRHRLAIGAAIAALVAGMAAALCAAARADVGPGGSRAGLLLNELRADQPGTDNDEYVELLGNPGLVLDTLTILVIGDGVGLSGCIEEIVHLDGHELGADGLFLVGQPQMTIGTPDLVAPLEFENADNLTFMLVAGFTGALGDDLDIDDDGVIDTTPWNELLDAVSIVENTESPPVGTEWWYAEPIGPGGNGNVPYQIRRCPQNGTWMVGPDDPAADVDTPGQPNGACPIDASPCPSDINGDTIVDGGDLAILLLNWGRFGDPEKGGGNLAADLDGNGMVDGIDLGVLLMNWNWCGAG